MSLNDPEIWVWLWNVSNQVHLSGMVPWASTAFFAPKVSPTCLQSGHWNALKCTEMHWNALKCTEMHWNALKCTEMHWNALKCTEMHWNALKCTETGANASAPCGGFLKWGYPQMDGLSMENTIKMDDLGYPYFRKASCGHQPCHATGQYPQDQLSVTRGRAVIAWWGFGGQYQWLSHLRNLRALPPASKTWQTVIQRHHSQEITRKSE